MYSKIANIDCESGSRKVATFEMNETTKLGPEPASPQLQQALLNALEKDEFQEFKNNLEHYQKPIKIDHMYAQADEKTLLDIACSSTNRAHYVQFLIEKGANVNLINKVHKAAPIHFAVLHSDEATLRLLVKHEDTDINLKNGEGKIALQLAGQAKKKNFMEILQARHIREIEQAKREILTVYTPHYNNDDGTNPNTPRDEIEPFLKDDILFELLFLRNIGAFKSEARTDNVKSKGPEFKWTYLQYACKLGYIEFVQLLLDLNVDPNEMAVDDPNEMTDMYRRRPIMIAGYFGYHEIVDLLISTHVIIYEPAPPKGDTVLKSIIDGYECWQKYLQQTEESRLPKSADIRGRDHLKCLELVLQKVPEYLCSADLKKPRGFTPLGCTGGGNNRDIVRCLLERGAYIGGKCSEQYVAIQYMWEDTLNYLLDRSTAFCRDPTTKEYSVKFNYNLLTCSNYNQKTYHKYIDETKPLLALPAGEYSPLMHPLFRVFLDFKWHLIMRKYFYLNLAFFVLFAAVLSLCLLTVGYVASGSRIFNHDAAAGIYWRLTLIGNIFMLVRRVVQDINFFFSIIEKRYPIHFMVVENWIERTLIAVVFVILTVEIESSNLRAHLAAAAIILAYVYLLLLILSHPRMSKDLEMIKIVAMSSCKFLKKYLILIIAFAFSFHLVFKEANPRNASSKDTCSSMNISCADANSTDNSFRNANSTNNPFKNLTQAIFKTLVMSMGEYDLSIMTKSEFSVDHFIMLVFIFMIPIVLFNLLNAIAVNDIQGIEKNAELLSIVSRARTIAQMEEIITSCLSLANNLANYYKLLVGKEPIAEEDDCLRKRYYLCNYFGVTSNSREITFDRSSGRCSIEKHHGDGRITFSPLPSTVKAIDRMIWDATHESEVDYHATLQKLNTNLVILKSKLEETDEKHQIVDVMLADIKKLLN